VDTFKEIQTIIADKLDIPPGTIRLESKAVDLNGWDSVNHIMIIIGVEEAFNFKFRLEEIGEMDSVQKLLRAVETRAGT
jgi:acyl carrier protein